MRSVNRMLPLNYYNLMSQNYFSLVCSAFDRVSRRLFHTSKFFNGLMEFFDDPVNWDKKEIYHGREWKKTDLQIKSNADLHKLWYVLYKEKNMLLTMQNVYDKQNYLFPSEERLDKVEMGMENLYDILRERNEAFYLLEEGVSGEFDKKLMWHKVGIRVWREEREWPMPPEHNEEKEKDYSRNRYAFYPECKEFQVALTERIRLLRKDKIKKKKRRQRIYSKRFPENDK